MNEYLITIIKEEYANAKTIHAKKFKMKVKAYSDNQVKDIFSCGGYEIDKIELWKKL